MKILSIVGARPQFVKAAVFREYCTKNGINEFLMHTGQHYDKEMSTGIFEELGVNNPELSYKLSSRSHGGMTGELITEIEQVCLNIKPDFVNVYGDTNSTVAGALAASKLNIPVLHIEAGLRSFNKTMPEEINRVLTDHMSEYLFCPTNQSVINLKLENIVSGVYHVGDIMYDAVKIFEDRFQFPNIGLKTAKDIAVITIHRAENIQDKKKLSEIIKFCEKLSDKFELVFPVHPNTRNKLVHYGINSTVINCIEPLKYTEMQGLLREASLVLTDSGGLQKEAYFHRVPCITLRSETEWVELIESGWNRLWISKPEYKSRFEIDEYGTGAAVSNIIEILRKI